MKGTAMAPTKLGLRSRWRVLWHNWRIKFALSTRRRLRAELARQIEASLSGLQHRLRKRYIPELCRLAIAQETNIRSLANEDAQERVATFAMLLMHTIDRLQIDSQIKRSRFNSLSRQCVLVFDERAYFSLIEQYLQDNASSLIGYLADRRALTRRLSLDALRERCDEGCYRNQVLIEIASRCIAKLWTSAMQAPGHAGFEARAKALQTQPQLELVRIFFLMQQSTSQIQLADDIASLLATGAFASLNDQTLNRFLDLLEDEDHHPWLRRNALRIIYLSAPDRAIELCATLLDPGASTAPDAFILRTLIIQDLTRLSNHHPKALSLLQAQWVGTEPSEHVRICLAQSLGRTPAHPMDVLSWLAKRVCLHRSDTPAERSPKVRSMAMQTISSIFLRDAERGLSPGESELLRFSAEAIDSSLQDEEDQWVCVQSCKQIQRLVGAILRGQNPDHFHSIFRAWAHTLTYRLTDAQSNPDLANQAAATLDLITIALDPQARQAFATLQVQLSTIAPGRYKNIKRDPAWATLSEASLGQIIAYLSRNDWGIYIDVRPKVLRVQRGDRFRMRLWRMLHESTHPSPNKRKGFVHSTGRVFRGSLRAHPFGLDEATATVVPGERISLGQNLGWGRHMPSIDDLIHLPRVKSTNCVELHSNYGKTRVTFDPGLFLGWVRWLRLSINYAKLARLRQSSLQASDPKGSSAFVLHLKERYRIQIDFFARPRPFAVDPHGCHPAVLEQFNPAKVQAHDLSNNSVQIHASPCLAPICLAGLDPLGWLQEHTYYFFSKHGNDQNSLSLFLTGALGIFLFQGYWRRRSIRIARDQIPLSIGGWGTRGKSGTERLKAALFHGLGYRVFSKTTGCEAMLIHSMAQGPQSEIFVFRPYGKATIWEQANLLRLAAKLDADVFLWECMALNPTYVSILQHGWMNDDLATITNAYPDHEDIQGPAGHNVAKVISTFIPKRSIALSSEINFHPMMRDRSHAQATEYQWVKPDQEAWIGEDMLGQFPYQEHPRNIALVAHLGERLGVEPDLCVYNMATQVVPDLGVLKTYGDVQVRGRIMRFINGCSANERAGFLNNWTRTGCSTMDPDTEPHRMLATVVNNRADRVSRSEVFARILVNDAAADKHVLIGTNLSGLLGYLQDAVTEHLKANPLFSPGQDPDPQSTLARFEQAVARFRCPRPEAQAWIDRLAVYARSTGQSLSAKRCATLHQRLEELFDQAQSLPASWAELQAKLQTHHELSQAVQDSLVPEGIELKSEIAECLSKPEAREIYPRWCELLAKSLAVHRLRQQLTQILKTGSTPDLTTFEREFNRGFSELFDASVHPVHDADIKGDQLIVRCAELFPPGVELTLLGSQNIKGTGLDLVYRWVAFGQIQQDLAKLKSRNPQTRAQALTRLEAFGDHGLVDLGLLRQVLPTLRANSESESTAISRLSIKVQTRYFEVSQSLGQTTPHKSGVFFALLDWVEGWIEFLDGARRYHQSKSLNRDLVHRRVSHGKATLEMREICGRTKGGWLAKWWKSSSDDV